MVMPRSLKDPVGFGALNLEPHITSSAFGDDIRPDQGRATFTQRDDRRCIE